MTSADCKEFYQLWLLSCENSAGSKSPCDSAIEMAYNDLIEYDMGLVAAALTYHRKTNEFPPTVANIVRIITDTSRIKSLHLSADEAWAECPVDERHSAVWTAQIGQAYYISEEVQGDLQAKRMAFKAAYDRIVNEAVRRGIRPQWVLSAGTDEVLKQEALQRAIDFGRITPSYAVNVAGYIPRAKTAQEALEYLSKTASSEKAKQAIYNLKLLLGAA
jgi:hypothetical protein